MKKEALLYEAIWQAEYNQLNTQQKLAVDTLEGPVLVVAGPGTGKTQILALRIGNILRSDAQVAPHNILCLTFTDTGAVAMRKRLLNFIGPTAHRVHIHTFHGFCNDIINSNFDVFGAKHLEPISESDSTLIIKSIIDQLEAGNPLKRYRGEVYFDKKKLLKLFSLMKSEDWTLEKIETAVANYLNDLPLRDDYIYKRNGKGFKAGDVKQKQIDEKTLECKKLLAGAKLYELYNQKMIENGFYDYNDMLIWVKNALIANEDLLRRYQEKYLYFLVDEFQDTSGTQSEILQILIDYFPNPNVFCVGDDDQSIFEFQGARIQNILDFSKKYEDHLTTVVLEGNYRSTQNILSIAQKSIENNKERLINKIDGLNKNLISAAGNRLNQKLIPIVIEHYNELHQDAYIIKQIEKLQQEGVALNNIAILYRNHKQADSLIDLCHKKGIPFQVKRKLDILTEPIILNVLKILEYIHLEKIYPNKGESLLFEILHAQYFKLNIADLAKISISKKYNEHWRQLITNETRLAEFDLEDANSILALGNMLNEWIGLSYNLNLPMLFEKILYDGNIIHYLLNLPDRIWLIQMLNTIFDYIKVECSKNPKMTVNDLMNQLLEMEDNQIKLEINKVVYQETGVQFVTTHGAKGEEYQYVFLIGCNKAAWESEKNTNMFSLPDTLTMTSQSENNIDASRRLFYVALTRAKEYLFINYSKQSLKGKDLDVSRFISEILPEGNAEKMKEILGHNIQFMKHNESPDSITQAIIDSLKPPPTPQIELLKKQHLQKALSNFSLSVSNLNSYLNCPISFYYQSILKVPSAKHESMAFGTAIHDALQFAFLEMQQHTQKEFPKTDDVVSFFIKQLYKHKDAFTDMQFERRLEYGKIHLTKYYDKYKQNWNKIVLVEYPIKNIEIDGVPVNGKLDKIEFNGKVCTVVDYKTGKSEYKEVKDKLSGPNEKIPNGGDYWRQMVFYKLLLDGDNKSNWQMENAYFDFVEEDTEKKEYVQYKIVPSPIDLLIVKQQMKDTYQKIMNFEFSKGCGSDKCTWCNFVTVNRLNTAPVNTVDENVIVDLKMPINEEFI
jgi:DNA helicase-2/ATP-dependent DNA helicase PcrA